MDKNTLSNYGWIVIAVLVLSVMIALATPFGEYIKSGVENTTQGLFDTSEKAMNVVGMSAIPTQPEQLEIVSITNYPNPQTFEYTETSTFTNYAVAKESTTSGGTLSVKFNENECSNFEMKVYLFDSNGKPAFETDAKTSKFVGEVCVPTLWVLPKKQGGFSRVQTSFRMPIPDGYTVMVAMRFESELNYGTVTDKSELANWLKNGGIEITMSNTKTNYPSSGSVKSIAHRGYSGGLNYVPENSITAFKLAKQFGFNYVETDVRFTSDNIPVLYHDENLDTTPISEMSYDQISNYDIGSNVDERYAGEKIPTFDKFVKLCKELDLHAYIDIQTVLTTEQADTLFGILDKYNMRKNVTWISFQKPSLLTILSFDESARIGLNSSTFNSSVISNVQSLNNGKNKVFLNLVILKITEDVVTECQNKNIALEHWGGNSEGIINRYYDYLTGITTETMPIGAILDRVLNK